MCLLLDVIQWFMENGIDYEPESIYSDVRVRSSILLLKFIYSEEAIKRTRSSWSQVGVILADFWGFQIFPKGPSFEIRKIKVV